MRIREDFAAAGGCSMALRAVGFTDDDSVGVEFEASAVATARAAGHRRIHADVRDVRSMDWSPLDGYLAGPPCQTFSAAGSGAGRPHLANLAHAVRLVTLNGELPEDAIREVADEELDERSILVLEPALVIARHRPTWVVLEQVPQVLPVWEAYAGVLRALGYSATAGILHAEQYGVPQTRRRAILVAHLDREVVMPTPTHSKFYPRDRARLDPDVLPWISMAQALGWAGLDVPGEVVRSNYGTGGDPAARGERQADEPAAAVTGKVGRNQWVSTGQQSERADGVAPYQRDVDEPSPTVTGRADRWRVGQRPIPEWATERPAKTITGNSPVMPGPGQAQHNAEREQSSGVLVPGWRHPGPAWRGGERWRAEPVPAVDGTVHPSFYEGPSPTIVGSFHPEVVAARGYRKPGDPPRQKTPGSVRVTVQEAGVLQSFPADYPWTGTSTQQYQQVGNAAPPKLIEAVLRANGITAADI